MRNKRLILLSVVLVTVFGVASIVMSAISKHGKVQLVFVVAPPKADVFVDGKKASKSSYQKPGNHKIKVSRDGYESYESDVSLNPDEPRTTIPVGLVPTTDTAKKEANKYEKDYKNIEPLVSKIVNDAGQAMRDKYPIMASLPFRSDIYNIEYARSDNDEFILQIFADSAITRQVAIAKIRTWGYDPTDYKVQFVGFANPFNPEPTGDH